jgi:hypothetical protein
MLDGGPGAAPSGSLDAWLVTDARGELIAAVRRLAHDRGVEAAVTTFTSGPFEIAPRPVVHTNHPTFGYLIVSDRWRVAWAPEFWRFPRWVGESDLAFVDAAGWSRPIRFRGGVGGHASVLETAEHARRSHAGRVIFTHIGRPSIRAIDAGYAPPFGEWGEEGTRFVLGRTMRRYRPGR